MVDRFRQPELPSLVVGTPGVDRSAGEAATAVAKAGEQATSEAMQFAQNQVSRAANDFSNSQYYGQHAISEIAYAQRLKHAGEVEQRNLQNSLIASNAKLDQQTLVDNKVAKVKAGALQNNDPYSAADTFTTKVMPQLRQQLLSQYPDPYTQKALLPQINTMLEAGRGELQAWAPKTVSTQINAKLGALPQQISDEVGKIDPTQPVADQISSFHKILANGLASYQTLKTQGSMIPGYGDEIDGKALAAKQLAGKQFLDNGISSIPDDETGFPMYRQWQDVVEHSEKYGVQVDGSARSTLISKLNQQKNQSLQTQKDDITSNAQIATANIKTQQLHLIENFDNPQVRTQIVSGLNDTAVNLQAQLKQLEQQKFPAGSPEDEIRKQKLIAVNQQIGQLLGGEKQGLQEKNQWEALQRNLVSFQHSMTTFAQGQVKFAQGQLLFQQGQQGKLDKAAQQQAVGAFNGQMQGYYASQRAILGMPLGPGRLKAAQDQATGMISTADAASKAGVINANQYETITKQANDLIRMSQYKHVDGFFGFGAGNKPITSGPAKVQAALNAAQQTAASSQLAQKDINHIQTIDKMIDAQALNIHEAAAVKKFMNINALPIIRGARDKKYTDAQIEEQLPSLVGKAFQRYRKGELH